MDTANDSYLLRLEQGEANGQWLTPSMNDQSIIMNTIEWDPRLGRRLRTSQHARLLDMSKH